MNERQKNAYEMVLNLRQLTFETNTVTRRAQNVVLQALTSPEDMIAVSKALSDHKEQHGW
jgi:hypothetical protein